MVWPSCPIIRHTALLYCMWIDFLKERVSLGNLAVRASSIRPMVIIRLPPLFTLHNFFYRFFCGPSLFATISVYFRLSFITASPEINWSPTNNVSKGYRPLGLPLLQFSSSVVMPFPECSTLPDLCVASSQIGSAPFHDFNDLASVSTFF